MAAAEFADDDIEYMDLALRLAARALGRVAPNPAVGCVLMRNAGNNRQVIGRGRTQPGGRPHAETEALAQATARYGAAAIAGASAYVTLEPCSHRGRTPPCVDALLTARIGRVVVACEDPDPRVSGNGIAALRDAGVEVVTGVCEAAARELNCGFLMVQHTGRPHVTVKTATTLDGRIATSTGQSKWITGAGARAWAHLLRARTDAIMVGVETAIRDDPRLDCRLPGLAAASPVRIVVDGRLRLPLTAKLVATAAATPTWIATLRGAPAERRDAFRDVGVVVLEVDAGSDGRVDLAAALAILAERGVTRLLVDGGAHLLASLFVGDLVDQLEWFRAPLIVGGDGVPASVAFGIDRLDRAPRFQRIGQRALGNDTLETFARVT